MKNHNEGNNKMKHSKKSMDDRAFPPKDLEQRLQKIVRAQGSNSRLKVTWVSDAKTLEASISNIDKNIELLVPQGWDMLQYEKIKEFTQTMKIEDPYGYECKDIVLHEVGHDKLKNDHEGQGCPHDMEGKLLTVNGVIKAMLEENKYSPEGSLYLENCISDIIDNTNVSRFSVLNGQSLFFAEQAEKKGSGFSALYEAFVKLNMHQWGTKRQKRFLSMYYKNTERVDDAVHACIKDLRLKGKKSIPELFDKDQWTQTFYMFAKHLCKLMDTSAPESLPGSGSQGKGYKVPSEFSDNPTMKPEDIDDSLMKRLLEPDVMRKIIAKRNEQGESAPIFVENWKAMDYLYQHMASEIYIQAETLKRGLRIPMAPVQTRRFDPEKDDVKDVLFGRFIFDEQGEISLAVPRCYVDYVARVKENRHDYPDLSIAVLDSSGSMEMAANDKGRGNMSIIPWGDNSKYHYAVLTYYGVEKALNRIGVGTKMQYNLVTFGSHTEQTGERKYEDRMAIKKKILNPSFQGSTNINMAVLRRACSRPGSVLMTISDGDIDNWDNIKDDFKRVISDKFYVHFQISTGATQASRDIESWGGKVVYISDASKMPKEAIDITKRFYNAQCGGELA